MKNIINKAIFCLSLGAVLAPSFGYGGDDGWIDVAVKHINSIDTDSNSCARYTAIFSANYLSHSAGIKTVPQARCNREQVGVYKIVFTDNDGRAKSIMSSDLENETWAPR